MGSLLGASPRPGVQLWSSSLFPHLHWDFCQSPEEAVPWPLPLQIKALFPERKHGWVWAECLWQQLPPFMVITTGEALPGISAMGPGGLVRFLWKTYKNGHICPCLWATGFSHFQASLHAAFRHLLRISGQHIFMTFTPGEQIFRVCSSLQATVSLGLKLVVSLWLQISDWFKKSS